MTDWMHAVFKSRITRRLHQLSGRNRSVGLNVESEDAPALLVMSYGFFGVVVSPDVQRTFGIQVAVSNDWGRVGGCGRD